MKFFFKKVKRGVAGVLSAIKASAEKVKNVLGRFEDRVWRLEDKMPRLKKWCCTVVHRWRSAHTAVQAFFSRTADTVKGKLPKRNGRPKTVRAALMMKWQPLKNKVQRFIPKRKTLFWTLVVNALILLVGCISKVPILFVLTMMAWGSVFVYAVANMERRAMLLMLSITFFVFLLGREFLQQFFNYQVETFPLSVANHTYLCLLLALVGLAGAYWLTKRRTVSDAFTAEAEGDTVRKVSRATFFVVLIPAVIYRFAAAYFVQVHGYFAFYTDFQALINRNIFLLVFSKLDQMAPVCMCVYMATLPHKKEFYKTAFLYAVYLVLTLGSGARGPFLLGVFLFLFYLLYRAAVSPAEGWFKRRYLIWCGGAFVAFALVFYFSGLARDGAQGEGGGPLGSIFGFLYSQGVSINVIKRGFMFRDQIPDGYWYSMNFTRSGFIAHLFNIPIYSGNSVETALYGGNFAHALSYLFMPESYLAGRGTGTSYVAELYHDFWYVGIVFGSALYGWLCAKTDTYKVNALLRRSCLFIMITQLLWAPRGSYSGMVTVLIAPSTVLILGFIFGSSWLWERRKAWRAKHRGEGQDGC